MKISKAYIRWSEVGFTCGVAGALGGHCPAACWAPRSLYVDLAVAIAVVAHPGPAEGLQAGRSGSGGRVESIIVSPRVQRVRQAGKDQRGSAVQQSRVLTAGSASQNTVDTEHPRGHHRLDTAGRGALSVDRPSYKLPNCLTIRLEPHHLPHCGWNKRSQNQKADLKTKNSSALCCCGTKKAQTVSQTSLWSFSWVLYCWSFSDVTGAFRSSPFLLLSFCISCTSTWAG